MNLSFKVILTNEDGVYYVGIPGITQMDFYSTYGTNVEEALENAKDYAILNIEDDKLKEILLENKKEIPLKENQMIAYIFFNLEYERALVKQSVKNKTVVIPIWLDILAQEQKLNFSQILRDAIKKELNI